MVQGFYEGGQAIKFEQFPSQGVYGATQFGVADYNYATPTTFNSTVFLDFVANSTTNATELFVNGVDTGSFVPFAVSLQGVVGLGATLAPDFGGYMDLFTGEIFGFASYGAALSADQIETNYLAFTSVPEPSSLAQLSVAASAGLVGLWRRRRVR